jgi:hypothetical protein
MVREASTFSAAFPEAALRPMAGLTELAVAEAVSGSGRRPEKVTRVLHSVFETIAGEPATLDSVRGLPCGTREWLLQRAAHHFRPDLTWFESACLHCGHPYDLSLDLAEAAQRVPDNNRSTVEVETSLGTRSFLVPNGSHEEAFSRRTPGDDPRRTFAALCGQSKKAEAEALQFDDHDLALIDEALETASPDIADEVQTRCPSCDLETTARIDPLLFAFPGEDSILQDTHLIATAYGWPHDQILALSARHRSTLAAMIARDFRQARGRAGRRPA